MAPELLFPEEFGFSGELLKQLPSRSTDIYAIGMTILEVSAYLSLKGIGPTPWQVLTGLHPFNDITKDTNVICKVLKEEIPDRPFSGFSDGLWELLLTVWVAERGMQLQRRPSASIVLDRLKEDIDHWGKSIVPLIPNQWQESSGYLARSSERCTLFMVPL